MEIIKLIFLGLDAAGKTTILNILAKRYSFISNVAPTRSIERHVTEVFGYNIVNWDIPGQQQYREDLTFKDIRTLRDVSILIFVLDVQDLKRTHTAIDYIRRVLDKIIEEKLERPYLSVFIHKMDPDVQENMEILKNAKRIQDEINKIAVGFNVDFFLTTMFLEPTILIAFSSVARKVLSRKRQEILRNILQNLADQLLLNALVLLDKNNFIVNYYQRTLEDFSIIQDFVYVLNSAYKSAKTHKIAPDELKLIVKDVTFVFMPLLVGGIEIFVVGSSHDPELSLIPIKDQLTSALAKVIR